MSLSINKHFRKNRLLAASALAGLVVFFTLILAFFGLFTTVNHYLSNFLYSLDNVSEDIVIITIDDKSTSDPPTGFGRYYKWNRSHFADLLTSLQSENPKVITFDVLFDSYTSSVDKDVFLEAQYYAEKNKKTYEEFVEEYSSVSDDPTDNEFAAKLKEFDNIILAAAFDGRGLIGPLLKFQDTTQLGLTNVKADEDGVIRSVRAQIDSYPSLGLASARLYLDDPELQVPTNQDGEMLLNFFGEPFSYQMIPFVDVVKGEFEPGTFTNKIVLIGSTASKEIHDEFITPRSTEALMPGVEIRANEIQTILDQKFLRNQSTMEQIITIALIALALALALNYSGVTLATVIALAALALYTIAAHLAYRAGVILNMIYPYIAIILTYLASWVYKYFIADKDKRAVKDAFGHYVSPQLIDEIAQNPDQLKLGGENKDITVFFTDIKDSTTLSEQTEPEKWVKQINEYFTVMGSLVKSAKGTLDKYEGDAIMGFWNAPTTQQDHAYRAYVTAISMQKSLRKLNTEWARQGRPQIQMRIGINSGPAIVGNFGSEDRFDYTAMGDTVNTASRLESSANKAYGTEIIIAGQQKQLTPEQAGKLLIRELDTVFLPGKKEAITIYELLALREEATEEQLNIVKIYEEALHNYRDKSFAQAIALLQKVPQDQPSQILLKRCEILQTGGQVLGLDSNMIFKVEGK